MSYKYYLHSRPAAPGAIPDGSIRVDEEDLGGRYGAVYYEKPRSIHRLRGTVSFSIPKKTIRLSRTRQGR